MPLAVTSESVRLIAEHVRVALPRGILDFAVPTPGFTALLELGCGRKQRNPPHPGLLDYWRIVVPEGEALRRMP